MTLESAHASSLPQYARESLMLTLIRELGVAGSWTGETHIQKAAYVLETVYAVPLDLPFILYRYGPFSFELRHLLAELRANLLLTIKPKPQLGASLSVTDLGERLCAGFPTTIARYQEPIRAVASWFNSRAVRDLERLGTALMATREHPAADTNEQIAWMLRVKPHLTREDAAAAHSEVETFVATAARC